MHDCETRVKHVFKEFTNFLHGDLFKVEWVGESSIPLHAQLMVGALVEKELSPFVRLEKELKLCLHLAAQRLPAVVARALRRHQVAARQRLRLGVDLVGEEEGAGPCLVEPGGEHHTQP